MALKKTTANIIKSLFSLDKTSNKGLYKWEWVVMAYLAATTIYILITYSQLNNPAEMLIMRAKVIIITAALYCASLIWHARILTLARATAQLYFLSWWYPDTYEINNILPNLDHIFASIEQTTFGFQPADIFADNCSNPIFSEIMYMAYAAYFPMIALTAGYYFFRQYNNFNKTMTVILTAFFIYYIIFILIPVTGPQYYYLAIGQQNIQQATFPNLYDYFHYHNQRMTAPGYTQGLFYQLVETAHQIGERPTAAFPSSHIGISLTLVILTIKTKYKPIIITITTLTALMILATVYIKAHYAIDVIAGIITAPIIYLAIVKTFRLSKR